MKSVSELIQKRNTGALSRENYWKEISELLCQLSEISNILSRQNIYIDFEGEKIWVNMNYLPESKNVWMLLDPLDLRTVPFSVIADGPYESFQAKVLFSLMSHSESFFDVGANMGFYSLCASVINPRMNIEAFEPNSSIIEFLHQNIQRNNVSNIHTHNVALGEEIIESADLFIPPLTGTGGGSFLNLHPEEGLSETRKVKIKTIDFLTVELNLKPDLMKIDVEGFEYSVLGGSQKTLREFRPTIVIELLRKWMAPFGHHPQEIVHMLNSEGYIGHAIGESSLRYIESIDEATTETNFIFVHNSRENHKKILSSFI